jgi:hypothetical protein
MNTEAIIRQAVRNTLNFVGCTPSGGPPRYINGEDTWKWDFVKNPTDAEVFENRVMYHFRAIQIKLTEDALRAKRIPVDMNELDESYADGFETGQNWKESYRPGGPWFYHAEHRDSDKHKALAAQLRGQHDAWLQGFDDARAATT